jgi:hypothetical protein
MKQDNITEMHIYVKYEILSFMRRQFSSLKVYIKIGQNRKKNENKTKTKNKAKVGICTKTVCHFDDGFCHT